MPSGATESRFIEPMLLLPVETLPEGPEWGYELKLDGYRAAGIKTDGHVRLRSRNECGEFMCPHISAAANV
jgi:ATP-dependent DNA ligase